MRARKWHFFAATSSAVEDASFVDCGDETDGKQKRSSAMTVSVELAMVGHDVKKMLRRPWIAVDLVHVKIVRRSSITHVSFAKVRERKLERSFKCNDHEVSVFGSRR